ncbi:hypothetical protein L7F22_020739 [Adiantum nelumboides]|nr:hypothetical protein [Adiantum nelumboides]
MDCYDCRVSQQGEFEWAQRFMDAMQRQGWRPDEKTYGSILAGCSHAAKVDEGQQQFRSMGEDYGLLPSIQHFNCLVDLLDRAGCLDKAERILQTIPPADVLTGWVSLLTVCKTFGDNRLGKRCFRLLAQWSATGKEVDRCLQYKLQNLNDIPACKTWKGGCMKSDKSLPSIQLVRKKLKTERVLNNATPFLKPFQHTWLSFEDSPEACHCFGISN